MMQNKMSVDVKFIMQNINYIIKNIKNAKFTSNKTIYVVPSYERNSIFN